MQLFLKIFLSSAILLMTSKVILDRKFIDLFDLLLSFVVSFIFYGFMLISPFGKASEGITGIIMVIVIIAYFKYRNYNMLRSVLAVCLALILYVFIDSLVSLSSHMFFDIVITREVLESSLYAYLIFNITFISILLPIAYVVNFFIDKLFHFAEASKNNKLILLMISFVVVILFVFYWLTYNIPLDNQSNVLLFTFSQLFVITAMIIGTVFFVRYRLKDIQYKEQVKTYQNQVRYTNELERLYNDLRTFKHDYKNVTLGVLFYLEKGDIEGAKNYYSEHVVAFQENLIKDDSQIDKLRYLLQQELKSVVWSKCFEAQQQHITVSIDLLEDIVFDVDIIDLCRIVGIWFDNALEALDERDADRQLTFSGIKSFDACYLIIENTVDANAELSIHQLKQKGYSTKGKNRGLGLSVVVEIIEAYDNITNTTEVIDGKFRQVLTITNRGR